MVNSIYISELLSYATFYMDSSCIDNIKKIIINFYSSEEIAEAKRLLWETCVNDLQPYTERKNTDKRSSTDANIADIFDAIVKLDDLNKLPNFAAKKIDR